MTPSHRDASIRANEDARLDQLARIGPLFAIAYAILWVLSLDTSKAIPRDGTTLVVGRDFLNFWMTGRASWGVDPKRFYDLATYQVEVARIVGPGYLGQVWSYPPSVMLLAAPFGLLPYIPALVLWSITGPLVILASLRTWTTDKRLLIALLLSPAAVFALISGQFAFLATALILTVLRWRDERPWFAGVLLGVLSIKPQLGLYFPVLLLATRNWRMIGGAALSSLAIMAITAAIWGPATWLAYVGEGIGTQSRVLSDPEAIAAPFMPTVFMNLRSAGLSTEWASAAQSVASILAFVLIAWCFWQRPAATNWSANALFLAAAVFGTPYLLSYDTLPLCAAVLLTFVAGNAWRLLTLAVWLLPLLQMIFGGAGIPGAALIPIAVALYLAKHAQNFPTAPTRRAGQVF